VINKSSNGATLARPERDGKKGTTRKGLLPKGAPHTSTYEWRSSRTWVRLARKLHERRVWTAQNSTPDGHLKPSTAPHTSHDKGGRKKLSLVPQTLRHNEQGSMERRTMKFLSVLCTMASTRPRLHAWRGDKSKQQRR